MTRAIALLLYGFTMCAHRSGAGVALGVLGRAGVTEKRSLSSWQLLFLLSCVGQGMSLAVFAAEQTVTGVALVLSFVCLIWLTGAEVMQEPAA